MTSQFDSDAKLEEQIIDEHTNEGSIHTIHLLFLCNDLYVIIEYFFMIFCHTEIINVENVIEETNDNIIIIKSTSHNDIDENKGNFKKIAYKL